MKWHRANGIEELQRYTYKDRMCFYELPVLRQDISDYLSYPVGNKLCVSLVLTDMSMHRPTLVEYPELLAKKLPWLVKHLCERTDMVDRGVGLRVGITNDVKETAIPYLEACNFPMGAVDWFDSRESEYSYLSKLDAMRQPAFRGFDKVLHIDLAPAIGTDPAQRRNRLFSTILDTWTTQKVASGSKLLHRRDNPFACNRVRLCVESEKQAHPVWEVVSRLYGVDAEAAYNDWDTPDPFYQVRGGICGFPNAFLLNETEYEKIEQLFNVAGTCDESCYSLYAYYNGWQESDMLDLTFALQWSSCSSSVVKGTMPFCIIDKTTCVDTFLNMHQQKL